ncbi:type VII secretion protein EsaA [Pseudogracilibacillus auburnensis]|uniref:Type VII secretion system accessory factor EsaA n=1 Tax=Pseudogracilibacillus auburnensis TaxID=1494959 RepID=A0A2V3VW39_9BACI|nr:type VII secretion protein EsaA [Pseudogracilibacillus auburnensis]PXW86203.1 type VII secretion EsaA-like protein [Pseudogracilibacillus auburnensis]
MKTIRWQGIAFFLLIFILSIGLSYLAFNENSTEHVEKEQKMSIALVNEDKGAEFNDDQIVFGDEFANSINKDSKHDWYVVSRGVAESGFNRNAYDMMIVIPNDFSEKSLSIHLDRPESVSLHYKINATGHENVRAEAEKTAGKILNDINTKLIDVYFASIIGNLQDAQDHIGEIIDKEKEYTTVYNDQINSPLTNYTDQFKSVQDYTGLSKESYKGLEEVLKTFETSLHEDAANNEAFLSEIDSVVRSKEDSSQITNTFGEFFDQFFQKMSHGDVLQHLAQLERENDHVHRQFLQNEEDQSRTIVSNATLIQKRFNHMVEEINQFEDNLQTKLGTDLESVIKDRLEIDFDEAYVPAINDLFMVLDENVLEEMKNQIKELPSLSKKEIVESGLAEDTMNDIVNVIHITNQFNKEFKNTHYPDKSNLISEKIKEIKRELATTGVTISDEIDYLPEYGEEADQYFYLDIPKDFRLINLSINGEEIRYQEDGIKLENPPAGKFSVSADLRLKDRNADIDVFAPIVWDWKVFQKGMEEEEIEDEPDVEPEPENPIEPEDPEEVEGTEEQEESKEENPANGNDENNSNEVNDNDEIQNEETENADEVVDETNDETPSDEDSDSIDDNGNGNNNGEDNNSNDPPLVISKTIIKTNNYLHQKVHSSLLTEPATATTELVEATALMVKDYYKLYSLYELYFGFEFADENFQEIDFSKTSLREIATEDSLYHFIHKKEIKDILKDHIAKNVTKAITSDVQQSMVSIEQQIGKYIELVNTVNDDSDSLGKKIAETANNANNLNDEVTELLVELASWRDTSTELVNEKNVVLDSDQDVQMAIMNLDTSYQPLLMASESLKEQARANFDSADHVYQTFDAIDEQAGKIQESGVNLVVQANDLAEKLTEKSIEDTNFADNFKDVLANSRVGDRQNENLYRFLANPVQTKNDGIITKGESFTGYFLVIIFTVVTLFTSYVISNMTLRKRIESTFDGEQSVWKMNLPISIITAGVGLIEGLVIGLISFYLLNFSQSEIYMWLGLITLLTIFMLLISTYLLRQLNMVGMFILLTILSLYLLLTKSLGFHFENGRFVDVLRKISPLQYVENLVANLIEGNSSGILLIIVILLFVSIIGFLLNLVVWRSRTEKGLDDENAAEAN